MNTKHDFFPTYDYFDLLNQDYTKASPYPRFTGFKGLSTSNPVYARDLRTAIDALRNHFSKEEKNIAPMNCLILGPPGAGKTYLAKQLTKSLSGVNLEEYNLSLSDNPKYLEEKVFCERHEKTLVFIDEFDVTISGSSVVRFILDPLTKTRDLPIAYVFSGSYLKSIQVLRSLGRKFADIDFSKFLYDLYLQEKDDDLRTQIAEMHSISIHYWENRHRNTPDHDVLTYLRGLDKLQDFLSRINGFIVQIPDLSSPMAITESWLSLQSEKCDKKTMKNMTLTNRGVSSDDVFEFVKALEAPDHLYWKKFNNPGEPVRDYKHMLLTERYGMVSLFLSEKFGRKNGNKVSIPRQLLNFLVMVPLLHNVRSLRFLIDHSLKEKKSKLEFIKPPKDLFDMHVDSRYLFRNPESLWRFLVARNGSSALEKENGTNDVQILPPSKGLVSVIITNHSYEKYIVDALDSIVDQYYELNKIELIISHDGKEETEENDSQANDITAQAEQKINTIVKEFNDKYKDKFWREIELIYRPKDQESNGKLSSLNRAIPKVHGEYVMILDADDMLEPNYISQTLEELEKQRNKNDKIGFVYTNCILFGEKIVKSDDMKKCVGVAEKFDKETFIDNGLNYIPEPAMMLTTALQCVIPFNESIKLPEQSTKRHKYTLLLDNEWQGYWLEKPLFKYRMHGKNESKICDEVEIVSRYCNTIPLAKLRQSSLDTNVVALKYLFSEQIKAPNLNDMIDEFEKMWKRNKNGN